MPPFTVVTFNVHGAAAVEDPVIGPALAHELDGLHPDVAALEECVPCDALRERLPSSYALVDGDPDGEVAILYRPARWTVRDQGTLVLGLNDDGWGRREARWAALESVETGALVYVYATHWCVPLRSPADTCDVVRQEVYGRTILRHVAGHDAPSVLAGDLNTFDGFEDGPVIASLEAAGLVDTLRAVTDAPVVTFEGNSWAPPGRIDYIFATPTVEVRAASVAAASASDHRPVSATVAFP